MLVSSDSRLNPARSIFHMAWCSGVWEWPGGSSPYKPHIAHLNLNLPRSSVFQTLPAFVIPRLVQICINARATHLQLEKRVYKLFCQNIQPKLVLPTFPFSDVCSCTQHTPGLAGWKLRPKEIFWS